MSKPTATMTLFGLALALVMSASPAGAQVIDEADRPAEDQITRLYQAVFGRDADAGGFEFWNDQYREGGSLTDIAAQFSESQEFTDRYGTDPTNAELVDAMYDNVLDRAGDADGVRFWLSQLESSAISQVGLLVAFADSQENIDRTQTSEPITAREAQILRLYRSAFGRFPDAGGFDFWMSEYTATTSLRDIALRFSQSPEFTDIYGTSPRPSELVDRLYRNVLDRSGDAGGVTFWEGQYLDGRSVPEMLTAFADSDENLQRTGTASNPDQLAALPTSIQFAMVETMSRPDGTCGDPILDEDVQATSPPILATREDLAFADLNNDGATDVVVQIGCVADAPPSVMVWLAGGVPQLVNINNHDILTVDSIDTMATARTSAEVAPGVVQIEWFGATSEGANCCPFSNVTTEITAVGQQVVLTDTVVNGVELNATRVILAAAEGGARPADIPVSDEIWDELTEWLDGTLPVLDTNPCATLQDDGGTFCVFATPGSPEGITAWLDMVRLGPDNTWTVTGFEGLADLG